MDETVERDSMPFGPSYAVPQDQERDYQNGLTLSRWVALLHQTPPVAAGAKAVMTREDLRRENVYEDRA